jgi:hypothetical protein
MFLVQGDGWAQLPSRARRYTRDTFLRLMSGTLIRVCDWGRYQLQYTFHRALKKCRNLQVNFLFHIVFRSRIHILISYHVEEQAALAVFIARKKRN